MRMGGAVRGVGSSAGCARAGPGGVWPGAGGVGSGGGQRTSPLTLTSCLKQLKISKIQTLSLKRGNRQIHRNNLQFQKLNQFFCCKVSFVYFQ